MKTNEEWSLFEQLTDDSLPEEQRRRLTAQIASDPELSKRFTTFQKLREWPRIASVESESAARSRMLERLAEEREVKAAELDLAKLFPLVFGGALAASLALALLNLWHFEELADGTIEALFGMPAETIDTVMVSQL